MLKAHSTIVAKFKIPSHLKPFSLHELSIYCIEKNICWTANEWIKL